MMGSVSGRNIALLLLLILLYCFDAKSQQISHTTVADNGWANNSVNTVVFRKNALTTFKNIQYTAFYDEQQFVVIAKRKLNASNWVVMRSQYRGDATDAHKSISIMVDGEGFLHVAWGQHNNALNYAKSIKPGLLVLGDKEKMLGLKENRVSYPEFYKLPNGDLLFFYRDGGSGNGNLMINRYLAKSKKWSRVQDNLIDGEGKRNAYVQTTLSKAGTIHISWVWRESPDVASNHDMCYAKSTDGGLTWSKSTGEKYQLPIRSTNAEYALIIPQNSELINQTSMFADARDHPFIATYWRGKTDSIPQYQLVFNTANRWEVKQLNFRKTSFTLNGGGTKKIPISRPQLITWEAGRKTSAALIFRDIERGNKVSMAKIVDLKSGKWEISDLNSESVGEWEPNFDTELWRSKQRLDLFVQKVQQLDSEGRANQKPTKVEVISVKGL